MDYKVYLKNIKDENFYYEKRLKRKKNGKIRIIHAPSIELKKIQRDFADWFYKKKEKVFKSKPWITGFMPGKSIADNAKPHLNKDWIINIDIKNFFPSTSEKKVERILSALVLEKNWFYKFFRPNSTGFRGMTSRDLASYLCLDKGLPQGSPASPIIANYIACEEIDSIVRCYLYPYINDNSIGYTRYADDLTISMNDMSREQVSIITHTIKWMINNKSIYTVNDKKIKIKHKSQRQRVTGIIVNGKNLGVTRELRNKLRAILHNSNKNKEPLSKETEGLLSFIKSVNPDQYNKLINNYKEKINECN